MYAKITFTFNCTKHSSTLKRVLTLPVPIPDEEKTVKLNFYFHTSLWCLNRFYEGPKGLHKTFRHTAKKCENKNLTYFLFQYNFQKCTVPEGLKLTFNPFLTNTHMLHPLKKPGNQRLYWNENQRVSGVFRGCNMGTLIKNRF